MNIKKAKDDTLRAIFILICFAISLVVLFFVGAYVDDAIKNGIVENHHLALFFVVLLLVLLAGIFYLVYYIKCLIHANQLKENNKPFILITIGFMLMIIGLAGLFVLRSEIMALEKADIKVKNPETIENEA